MESQEGNKHLKLTGASFHVHFILMLSIRKNISQIQTFPQFTFHKQRDLSKVTTAILGNLNFPKMSHFPVSILLLAVVLLQFANSQNLKYVWGDALSGIGDEVLISPPNGIPHPVKYPFEEVEKFAEREKRRNPRSLSFTGSLLSPEETRSALLRALQVNEGYDLGDFNNGRGNSRRGRSEPTTATVPNSPGDDGCVPTRLCETTYNTTAPMFGISLTSGQPVTIVQKFPDLLQQVVYQVCKSEECDVIQGQCVQTYLPYLFLVIPLGPVTLTGQDYVLVESGCACKPKYAKKREETPNLPFIQGFNMTSSNTNTNSNRNSNSSRINNNQTKPRVNKRIY